MAFIRKFALVISMFVCGSLALAAAAVAAGGGGGLSPGDYVFSNTNAEGQFGFPSDPNQTTGFTVFVNQGMNSFQLEHPKNSPPAVSSSTMVQLQILDATGTNNSFCFILKNPSDFTVSANLKSAALHTLLTPDEMCSFGAPVPGKGAATPFAGSGGTGPQPPFQVDVTWTANGVTGSGRDRGRFTCGSYAQDVTNTTKTAGSNATGTIAGVSGPLLSTSAGINQTSTNMDIKGAALQGCFG
jgi:hypothetical protein